MPVRLSSFVHFQLWTVCLARLLGSHLGEPICWPRRDMTTTCSGNPGYEQRPADSTLARGPFTRSATGRCSPRCAVAARFAGSDRGATQRYHAGYGTQPSAVGTVMGIDWGDPRRSQMTAIGHDTRFASSHRRVRLSKMRVPWTRGATSGVLLVILGA